VAGRNRSTGKSNYLTGNGTRDVGAATDGVFLSHFLFNDAVDIVTKWRWMIDDELRNILKETIVGLIEVQS
jgi:hypothetical protein